MTHAVSSAAVRPGPRLWGRGWIADLVVPLIALVCAPGVALSQEGAVNTVRDTIAADTVWAGRVTVERQITVEPHATLTIHPGAHIRFLGSAGLQVQGTLIAEGTRAQPIVFAAASVEPAPGFWAGITLFGGGDASRLRHCRITHATAVSVNAGSHRIEHCEISGGVKGVVVAGRGTEPILERNRLADLREGGIECLAGAAPQVAENTLERCGAFGIGAISGATPTVVRNTITGCDNGIDLQNTAPLLRDNTLRGNGKGIKLTQVNGGRPIQGNRILENDIGILCEHFSAPEIAGNTISGNKLGIVCYMGAHPLIRANEIFRNGTGVTADQIANPTVNANEIFDNDRGLYLNLSSYAAIRGNNIVGNKVQLELGNMSSDWEQRAGKKPERGLQKRGQARLARGVGAPPAADAADGAAIAGLVDAAENWWGEDTTREMSEKGPDANIAGLIDAFDTPTRTYDGYEGEFAQDRIRYAPWASAPVATGVVPAAGAAPAAGAVE